MSSRSARYSIGLAVAYGVVAVAYIVISSSLAADVSASKEELQRIETLKGVLYVVVTTVAVGIGGYFAMRRMERLGQELVRRERALVANQGRVVAGVTAASIAHDVNNVLTIVLSNLGELEQHVPARHLDLLEEVRTNLQRLIALNRRLLSTQRPDAARERQWVDLWQLVGEGVAALRAHDSLKRCRIVFRGGQMTELETQPSLVHQVLANLLLNAAEATGGEGTVEVVVDNSERGAVLEVHDNGPGIAADRRASLFDALTTTKPGGTGLGLFSVRACVQGLGGSVEVGDSPLGGARFRVVLPHRGALLPV